MRMGVRSVSQLRLSPDNTSARPVTSRAAFAPVINNAPGRDLTRAMWRLAQVAASFFLRDGLALQCGNGRRQMMYAPLHMVCF
jgi:hypothetical protein